MGGEAFCEKHGPYDADLPECPYCARQSGGRPQAPKPLEEEELNESEQPVQEAADQPFDDDDDLETDPRGGLALVEEDLGETELPSRHRKPAPDRDEEAPDEEEDLDETELPQRRRVAPAPSGLQDEEDTVVERAEAGLLGWLIVKEGLRRGQVYRLHSGITIGRDRADILVRDSKISRPHAKLTIESERFVLWDFGTENGTYVNGERIRQATPLNENDVIGMGDTLFVLKTLQ
jgi:hypothetical protein